MDSYVDTWTTKMETVFFSKTLISTYVSSRQNRGEMRQMVQIVFAM